MLRAGRRPRSDPGLPRALHDQAANFPWQSHALWFYSQMVRWGQTEYSAERADIARRVYRPDLYRAALKPTEARLPNASSKVEGALTRPRPVASRMGRMVLGPDGFFDGLRSIPTMCRAIWPALAAGISGHFALHKKPARLPRNLVLARSSSHT